MCGIAGWITEDGLSPEQKKAVFEVGSEIFKATQSRGTDAAGFSYTNRFGELVTVKGPITSESMIKEPKFLKLAEAEHFPSSIIMHCRQMTKGDPIKNENNHPLVVGKEIALVHNGCISNDDELRKKYELKSKGEVDSEAIPLMIKMRLDELVKNTSEIDSMKISKAINLATQELTGGFACAMIDKFTPNALYLFNNRNPIVLAYSEELRTFFFASTDMILGSGFNVLPHSYIHTFFQKKKYISHDVDSDTITCIKRGEDGNIEIMAYELKSKAYNNYAAQPAQPLTRTLKKKSIFSSVKHVRSGKEDWEIASDARAHGASCGTGKVYPGPGHDEYED